MMLCDEYTFLGLAGTHNLAVWLEQPTAEITTTIQAGTVLACTSSIVEAKTRNSSPFRERVVHLLIGMNHPREIV